MGHNRKISLGGTSLTLARCNRHTSAVMIEICNEIECQIMADGYLENAPFLWVGLILRFGLKNEDQPHYQRIDTKDGELPVAIELDEHELRDASREELKQLFMIATLKTLIHIGTKYSLPQESFSKKLRELQAGRDARV